MSARDAVFAKIRRSLGVTGAEPTDRNAAVDNRLRTRPRGVVPARGQLAATERLALFTRLAEAALASVARVANGSQVPAAVAPIFAPAQPAGGGAHGRRQAPCRHAVG